MKKLLIPLVSISALLLVPVFSSGDADSSSGTKSNFVALVTDIGGIDDKSFNQSTWEGVERFMSEYGEKYGLGSTFLQSASDADYIPGLSTVADDGYKLIVAPGFLFTEAIGEVSDNYPDTHFLIIDSVVADYEQKTNVVNAIFSEEQGSFLVGVAAGLQALKEGFDKVGFIGGLDFPVIQRFESGFEAGVAAVAPGVEVRIEYAGSFADAQIGQTVAAKLFDEGAQIIFHAAGQTGNGLFKEAKDRKNGGAQVWAIGVDRDQYEEGLINDSDSIVLTSMVKRVDVAAYEICKLEFEGNFPGGQIFVFNLANDGVGIPSSNPNLSDDILSQIESYKAQIIDGSVIVPTLPKRLQ